MKEIKVVVLRLDGTVQQGLQANVEIGLEGERPTVEFRGKLPPQTDYLRRCISNWYSTYRGLGLPTRLVARKTALSRPVDDLLKECSTSAHHLSEHFKEWLNSKEFWSVNLKMREELKKDEIIQVIIRFEDTQLVRFPWHLWDFFDSYQNAEVAFSTSAYRQVSGEKTFKNKVNILAILGNSEGIDVEKDRQLLEDLPDTNVKFLVEPCRKELDEKLWSQSWDVVFFAGHSETMAGRGTIHVNPQESLAVEDLRNCLHQAISRGLKLVILNSCDGIGLAADLEKLYIPQMIVMREPVPDLVAQEFLKNFLNAYSNGKNLYLSVREARKKLQSLENSFPCASWLPVIFQNLAESPPSWASLLGRDLTEDDRYPTEHSFAGSSSEETSPRPAPTFNEDEIRPITEIVCFNGSGEFKDIGKVKRPIRPGFFGRVQYDGTCWDACLYPVNQNSGYERTVGVDEKVKVLGLVAGSKLVVTPPEYTLPQPKQKKPRSFSLWSSLRFW